MGRPACPLGVSVRGPIAEEHHVEALANDLFGIVVTKTLVPIFNTLIDAILTWVFGKPLFEALAERI